MMTSMSTQSLGIKSKRLRFSSLGKQGGDDELTLVTSGDENLTPDSSSPELTSPAARKHSDSHRPEIRRSPSRFQDALNEYASYRHSLAGRAEESGIKRVPSSTGRHPSGSLLKRDVSLKPEAEIVSADIHTPGADGEDVKQPTIRILRAYSNIGQSEEDQLVGNCCKNFDSLRLVSKDALDNTIDCNSSQARVSKTVSDDVTSRASSTSVESEKDNVRAAISNVTGKKQKRSVKKLFRISKKLGRGSSRRKGTSTKGVRFEILQECPTEGEVENVVDGQGKSKKKRKAARRIAKTAGKRLWKGFRVGCKFLWEGLIIYAKPFGTMDFTGNISRAWDEKNNTYNSNNNNQRSYHNYDTAERVKETVL